MATGRTGRAGTGNTQIGRGRTGCVMTGRWNGIVGLRLGADWTGWQVAVTLAATMAAASERGAAEAAVARESKRKQREVFMKGSSGGMGGWFTAYLPTPAPILRGLRDFSRIAPESAVGLANRMPICDVCNAEAEGVTVPVRVFQRAVADGKFNPFRLGLATGRAGWSARRTRK